MVFSALAAVAITSLLVTLVVALATHRALSRKRPSPMANDTALPAISLLKPLKGLDDDLYENLTSFAEQDYQRYEIVFGAEDPADAALVVARRVQAEHPHISITVVSGAPAFGVNPKVTNLAHMQRYARFPWILVSDSNVRADAHYLRTMAAELADPKVALVHSVLVGTNERSLGAALENLHLASFVVSAVCGADAIADRPCVIGKSMLMHRSSLAALGGLRAVKDVLAEDYLLGDRFMREGHRVALAVTPLRTITADRTVSAFAERHLRWGQMRRWIAPGVYLAEGLMNPLPWAVLAGVAALASGFSPLPFVAACLTKALVDASLFRRLRGQAMPWAYLPLVPMKDCIVFGLWVVGAVKRTIVWRGNVMRISEGSTLTAISGAHSGRVVRVVRRLSPRQAFRRIAQTRVIRRLSEARRAA